MEVAMSLRVALPVAVLALAACSGGGGGGVPAPIGGSGTPTPIATVAPSSAPTHTAAPGSTATPTPAPGSTATPTPGATATPTAAPTATPHPTATPVATATPTPIPSSTATASILVHAASKIATVSNLILGANMAGWVDITESGLAPALASSGFTATRWPGGSESDEYHWQNNASCNNGYTATNSTFDNFMTDIAKPANLDVAITLDYGSNAACNAGGDPTEAAAWVSEAKSKSYGIKYWTVGNEEYGSWEYDLHSSPHNPATYASALATGFYPQIKAADSNAQVGAVVEGDSTWDSTVLANGKYDFVELHFYFTGPGQENDQTLLTQGAPALTTQINYLKSELASAGHATTPIYVGELGSVYSTPGKQAMSITQGLFAGMVLGELMNDGVFRATWWLGFGGCSDASSGANFSSSLYGWQNFGGYMILSDGTPEDGCPSATAVPRGTPFPTARAFQLMSQVAHEGEHSLTVTTASSLSTVRSYAATHGSGYAVVLFNLDETNAHAVNVGVDAMASGSGATITTYGKAQYDESQNNVWAGPVSSTVGAWQHTVPVTLPPWSMNVVILNP
jgi:hypothetical protein